MSGCLLDRDFHYNIEALNGAHFISSNLQDDFSLSANADYDLILRKPPAPGGVNWTEEAVGKCNLRTSDKLFCAVTRDVPSVPAKSTLMVRGLVGRAASTSCTESFWATWHDGEGEHQRPLVISPPPLDKPITGNERPPVVSSGDTDINKGNGLNDWGGMNDTYDIITGGICS